MELIEGLTEEERALVIAALRALRRERGRAWNAACDLAEREGHKSPPLSGYGIRDIERLARRFGGTAPHWLDD
jgi:hypothetical protein